MTKRPKYFTKDIALVKNIQTENKYYLMAQCITFDACILASFHSRFKYSHKLKYIIN